MVPSRSPTSWIVQIFGWFRTDAARASRSNRSTASWRSSALWMTNFSATMAPGRMSSVLVHHSHPAFARIRTRGSARSLADHGAADESGVRRIFFEQGGLPVWHYSARFSPTSRFEEGGHVKRDRRQANSRLRSLRPTTPQVATFTITIAANAQVIVEFGPDNRLRPVHLTRPAPPGGGPVTILWRACSRARRTTCGHGIQFWRRRWLTTADQTFQPELCPSAILPTLTATTAPGPKPSYGCRAVNGDRSDRSVPSSRTSRPISSGTTTTVADNSWKGYAFPIRPLKNGNCSPAHEPHTPPGVPNKHSLQQRPARDDLAGNPIRELYLADLKAALSTLKTPQGFDRRSPRVQPRRAAALERTHDLIVQSARR